MYGDSLSAAYGLPERRGWVALLEERLKRERPDYNVANASISGETTAGGLARIATVLERHKPAVVIVELGANDGLRGLPVAAMKKNLAAIIGQSQKAGAKVLLVACAPEAEQAVLAEFSKRGFAQAKVIGRLAAGTPRLTFA